jgi:phenylalanyl-tRNA synthetase beta chain
MKVPLSWLKDFVDIEIPIEELAHRLTLAGLEVEEVRYVGLPIPQGKIEGRSGGHLRQETKVSGFAWNPDEIVVGAIHEVMPHPNADRLVLTRLDDGEQEHIVLTGAPNLFEYKGKGQLDPPLKVAYAKEGATIIDAYNPGDITTKLKRKKIRGVESYSMACSERELGISDEHEGIIILDNDAPVGIPLVEYMGDAVLDIAITPNIARNANIIGVAREVAALTDAELRYPSLDVIDEGAPIEGRVSIEITDEELNPRFVLGLIENITIKPSPYTIQRRLKLAGMRPIDNVVDATNYAMLELGEPLHAFDYDILVKRAGGIAPQIITRSAKPGEKLVTLDDIERTLDDYTVMVCDQSGPLALAGVMGGAESEVSEVSRNILLEGASWNMINTRRTVVAHNLDSEAAYRFSRGVHPEMASKGVLRGLELMRQWSGGVIAKGLVENYPSKIEDPTVEITCGDVRRWLGIDLTADQIGAILRSIEFDVKVAGDIVEATTPPHRLDIGTGVIGIADLMEEIARIYGYDRIPETRMSDELPPQKGNLALEIEEKLRDLLVDLGLQEVITHRLTSPERETRILPPQAPIDDSPYFKLANPVTSDRVVMRHSLLASVLEIVERNGRIQERIGIFEIGPIYLISEEGDLPDERVKLVIALTGPRRLPTWQSADTSAMDFYDLKGLVNAAIAGLHITDVKYAEAEHPSYHPGKCARILVDESQIGILGELHPQVSMKYDLPETPLLIAELDVATIIDIVPTLFDITATPSQPPILEDIALIIDETIPADRVEKLIRQTGGKTLTDVRLFDVYRGEQIGAGKKSLAYSLTYQDPERTLTDKEVAKIRHRIVRRVEQELGAKLRGEG